MVLRLGELRVSAPQPRRAMPAPPHQQPVADTGRGLGAVSNSRSARSAAAPSATSGTSGTATVGVPPKEIDLLCQRERVL